MKSNMQKYNVFGPKVQASSYSTLAYINKEENILYHALHIPIHITRY